MKLVVTHKSLRWIQRGAQRALFACAALLLGYCGFVLVNTWIFQHRENQSLDRLLNNEPPAQHGLLPSAAVALPPAIGPDGLIGRIEIQRLGVSVVVVEGTGKFVLRRAVGHIVGTALPGQPGNMGVAAHRDTFFRPLRNIRPDDIITLTTLRGEYRYRVVSTKVVKPSNVASCSTDWMVSALGM